MYIVYGGKFTRTVCVQMVLEEGELSYELRELDILHDEHRSPEFLSINPAGYIPAMITPECTCCTRLPLSCCTSLIAMVYTNSRPESMS